MTQHTPGPWAAEPAITGEVDIISDAARLPVCTVPKLHPGRMSPKERQANARLIAAAPQLFEALQLAEATIERLNRHDSANGTLDVIRTALSEVTP